MAEKIYVPLIIKREMPWLYDMALLAKTQKTANKVIGSYYPHLVVDIDKPEPTPDKMDAQVAGSYSLELCQGGAGVHIDRKNHPEDYE